MNKIKIIQSIISNLKGITDSLEDLAEVLNVNQGRSAELTKVDQITIVKVRAVLAEKSQSGKQPEVKALITKFGAKKLTDIDPSCYEELLKEASEL